MTVDKMTWKEMTLKRQHDTCMTVDTCEHFDKMTIWYENMQNDICHLIGDQMRLHKMTEDRKNHNCQIEI